MSNEQNNIDDLFRGKLRDYSVEAPEHVWGGIVAGRKPFYKALQFLKLNKGGVAIALLLVIAGATATYYGVTGNEGQLASNAMENTDKTAASNVSTSVGNNGAETVDAGTALGNNNSPIGDETPISAVNTASTPVKTIGNTGADERKPAALQIVQNNPAPTPTEAAETNETRAQLQDVNLLPYATIQSLAALGNIEDAEIIADNESLLSPDKVESLNGFAIKPPKMQKWTWDVHTSIDFTARSLAANGANANYVASKEKAENYTPGFSIGARVNYDLTNCIKACIPTKLRVGLQYTALGEKVNFENKVDYTTITTKTVYKYDIFGNVTGMETMPDTISGTNTVTASNCNKYSFIDLPIQLEMQLYRTRRINLFTTVGGVANLMFVQSGQRIKTDLSGVESMRGNTNPYKTNAGLSALAGLGLEYKMCGGFSVLAEGTYRHGLSNVMNSNAGMRQNMRSVSASVGMRFRF